MMTPWSAGRGEGEARAAWEKKSTVRKADNKEKAVATPEIAAEATQADGRRLFEGGRHRQL